MHKRTGNTIQIGELITGHPVTIKQENIPAAKPVSSSDIIFFQIHHKETRKAMANYITKYNKELETKYPSATKEVSVNVLMKKTGEHQKKTVTKKAYHKDYSRLALKACHERTAHAILDMYAAYLKNNGRFRIMDGTFKTNNQAIRTKLNDRISDVTIWRHITRLIEAGVLQNKIFNGSNTSYTIEFNPEFLVADVHEDYTRMLIKVCKAQNNNGSIPQDEYRKIQAEKPSFTAFPAGWCASPLISLCSHTVRKDKQEQNINKGLGVCSKDNTSCDLPNTQLSQKPLVSGQELKQEHGSDNSQILRQKNLSLAVAICWNIALAIFSNWAEKLRRGSLTDKQVIAAKNAIEIHLRDSIHKGKTPQHFVNSFASVLHNQQRFLNRCNYAFMPGPDLYFDKNFKCEDGSAAGFLKAKEVYLKNIVKWKKKNTEHNKRMKLVCSLFRDFSGNPVYEEYRKAIQQLGKIKDSKMLDMFNKCVLNHQGITNDEFQKIWKKEMEHSNTSVKYSIYEL